MHHLGVPFPVTSVEQVEHLLLEFLAVFVNVFSRLNKSPDLDDLRRKKGKSILCQNWVDPLPSQQWLTVSG